MTTYCIGRLLVDLPDGFTQTVGSSSIFTPVGLAADDNASAIHLTLLGSGVTQADFEARVQQRRVQAQAASHERTDIVAEVKALSSTVTRLRIREIGDSYTSELHVLKGDSYLKLTSASYNETFLAAERRLDQFVERLELAQAPETTQGGFCLGPVTVRGTYEGEYATFSFRSKQQPDLVFRFAVDTFAQNESESLLQRMSSGALVGFFIMHQRVLRKGRLEVAGMDAQEWLGSIKLGQKGDQKTFGFALETMRPTPGLTRPSLHMEMDSGQQDLDGNKHANSLTDKDAKTLWDAVTRSLRLRPGAGI